MRAFVSLMKEKNKNRHASISDSRLQRDHSFSSGSLRTQATYFTEEDCNTKCRDNNPSHKPNSGLKVKPVGIFGNEKNMSNIQSGLTSNL